MSTITLQHWGIKDYEKQPDQEIPGSSITYNTSVGSGDTFRSPSRSGSGSSRDRYGFRPYTNYGCTGVTFNNRPGITYSEQRGGTGNYRYTSRVYGGTCIISASMGSIPPIGEPGGSQGPGLLTSAYADAKEQAFDVSTNLGELPEVISLLAAMKRRLAASAVDTIREYLRRNRNRPIQQNIRELLTDFSNIWLEYRYGWRPLVSSIQDLNAAIQRVRVGELRIAVGQAEARTSEAHPSFSYAQQPYGGNNVFRQNTTVTRETTTRYGASCAILVSPVDHSFSASLTATIWELIPFSFIVDWVASVGDWCRALSVDTQFPTKTTMCVSTLRTAKATVIGQAASNSQPLFFEMEKFSYQRKVVSQFTPTVRFRPSIDIPRGLDLTALILQYSRRG